MELGVILQARMGSSRLPGKVLMDFEGETLLGHILRRLEKLQHRVKVVIATSDLQGDDAIHKFCEQRDVACFRGDEGNVLKRYYDCAVYYKFDHIVRMTGDNPFPDIEELDRLIEYHMKSDLDFSENFSVLPIGVGVEIMSFRALDESMKGADLPKHFEHADEYILDNKERFAYGTLKVSDAKNKPNVRLTVDTLYDYEKACYILRYAQGRYVTTEQAIEIGEIFEAERTK